MKIDFSDMANKYDVIAYKAWMNDPDGLQAFYSDESKKPLDDLIKQGALMVGAALKADKTLTEITCKAVYKQVHAHDTDQPFDIWCEMFVKGWRTVTEVGFPLLSVLCSCSDEILNGCYICEYKR